MKNNSMKFCKASFMMALLALCFSCKEGNQNQGASGSAPAETGAQPGGENTGTTNTPTAGAQSTGGNANGDNQTGGAAKDSTAPTSTGVNNPATVKNSTPDHVKP